MIHHHKIARFSLALAVAAATVATIPVCAENVAPAPKSPLFGKGGDRAEPNQTSDPDAEGSTKRVPRPKYDIMAMSEFVAFHGEFTLVPKGAILHVPEKFQGNVIEAPRGKFLIWKTFRFRHVGRIAAFEITTAQATGAEPIDPARLAAAARAGRILVAAIRGNPTSVAPPRAASPDAEQSL